MEALFLFRGLQNIDRGIAYILRVLHKHFPRLPLRERSRPRYLAQNPLNSCVLLLELLMVDLSPVEKRIQALEAAIHVDPGISECVYCFGFHFHSDAGNRGMSAIWQHLAAANDARLFGLFAAASSLYRSHTVAIVCKVSDLYRQILIDG